MWFRGSIAPPARPLSTLRCALAGRQRMTRGQRDWLDLRCRALSSPAPCRFIPTLSPIKHHVAGPGANPRVADRSNAGRPRAQAPHHQPRARTTPPTAVQLLKPRTQRLTRVPCTSKEEPTLARFQQTLTPTARPDESQKDAAGIGALLGHPEQPPTSRPTDCPFPTNRVVRNAGLVPSQRELRRCLQIDVRP
jgi:hypothetical protein